MNGDYLGLLAAIITATGLIVAALIGRGSDDQREAKRRAHEKRMAETLAGVAGQGKRESRVKIETKGSGCSWAVLVLLVFFLIYILSSM